MRETIDFGIDLGTTNSEIACLERGEPRIFKNNEGHEFTSSAIYENKKGKRYVGDRAKAALMSDHKNVASEFKLRMGEMDWRSVFPNTGNKLSAIYLSAQVLTSLINNVYGETVHTAVITVPEAFRSPKIEATKKAGKLAKLKHVVTLAEPIAACLAYGLRAESGRKTTWLVYDLGGGTFDAALVRAEEGHITVFDHEGDEHSGGKNIDEDIVKEYLIPALEKEYPDVKGTVKPRVSALWWSLKVAAEEAKIQLSIDDKYEIYREFDGNDFYFELTRDQLASVMAPILVKTLIKLRAGELGIKSLFERNRIDPAKIERVILIGGPTRSPILRDTLEGRYEWDAQNLIRIPKQKRKEYKEILNEGLGIKIDVSLDAITAVAVGAAIFAKGESIPNDVRDVIRKEEEVEVTAPIVAELDYKRRTTQDDLFVGGSLKAERGPSPGSGWQVKIERIERGENGKVVVGDSGMSDVNEKGAFGINVLIDTQRRANTFRLLVFDPEGRQVEIDSTPIEIIFGPDIELNMPRGIGVGLASGKVAWFYKKGDIIPEEGINREIKDEFITTKALKRGESGKALEIPILEGTNEKAQLNLLIGGLVVSVDKLEGDLPKGSDVDITIEITRDRSIKAQAFFPILNDEFEADLGQEIEKPNPKNIREEIKKVEEVIAKLSGGEGEEILRIGDYTSRVSREKVEVPRDVQMLLKELRSKIHEVEQLLKEFSEANRDPGQSAKDELLRIQEALDKVADADKVSWFYLKTTVEKNIKEPSRMIIEKFENGEIPVTELRRLKIDYEKDKTEFDRLESELEKAIESEDYEKTSLLGSSILDIPLFNEFLVKRGPGDEITLPNGGEEGYESPIARR